ncbi:PEP-CTERM sorting domain-containing protein [Marinobacter sp. SS5-14b]|uniref:PEP-CTERM sorting domain-containing protein n=1 Tax=Marinobacter sp. SS5-14b TaxID=3050456 RepID=UPI0026E03A4D|nr:PEP-CTERM sorting domain-containing protein [Marinobacter sp. SS5-14b]
MDILIKKVAAFVGASLVGSSLQAALISESDIIADWSSEKTVVYDITNNANWSASGNAITNGGNYNGALVSDFESAGNFTFSTLVKGINDNDYMGVVFGWQDSNNSYGLGWNGGGLGSTYSFNGIGLYKEVGGVRTILASDATTWSSGVAYDFEVGRSGSNIFASIKQGESTIFSASIADTAFMSGKVGFDTLSQEAMFGSGKTDYSEAATVPEPGTLALLGLGLAGITVSRRKAVKSAK